jgi:serine/threonine protein kinase/Flp pilus assembly protein TadD
MVGKVFSHYRILEKLGEGGMGVVYKAEDTRLRRTVALKFLPPALTTDPDAKERFTHEAEAASALDHPNICNIHEIGETVDGQLFIAMACYDGESLKKKIERGPIPVDQAVGIAIQVARGLEKTHASGIVHRDIKPANIMVTNDGVAKIVDFGVAKLSSRTMLTKSGSTLGTVAYLSPEQARGDSVDQRADLWSLGVTLYEMLSGRRPFTSDYEQAIIYAILNENPPSLKEILSGIPDDLEQIIVRLLQKEPDKRFQSMHELVASLQRTTTAAIEANLREKSIVVLPFENMSADRDQEYFSDGLTEEVISDLSAVRALRVVSRRSAMTFKGMKQTVPEIARKLNVGYVLEGSVRRSGNSLRITAQLIDASQDAHLWSERYSGTLDDVFSIQEKVSRAIVDALQLKLGGDERSQIAKRYTSNQEAYNLYFLGRYHIHKAHLEDDRVAIEYFRRAAILDDRFALAHAGIAESYVQMAGDACIWSEVRDSALAAANRAVQLDNQLAPAHGMLGFVHFFCYNLDTAEQEFRRALALDPSYSEGYHYFGHVLIYERRFEEGIAMMRRAVELEPLSALHQNCLADSYFYCRRYEDALQAYERVREIDPTMGIRLNVGLSQVHTCQGNFDDARRDVARAVCSTGAPPWFLDCHLAMIEAAAGKTSEAVVHLRRFEELARNVEAEPLTRVDPMLFARIYARLHMDEQALHWIERAFDEYPYGFLHSAVLPEFSDLLQYPHFLELLGRGGLVR